MILSMSIMDKEMLILLEFQTLNLIHIFTLPHFHFNYVKMVVRAD